MAHHTACQENTPLGAYIHIPFCRSRCPYCDFVSNAIPGAVPGEFLDALCDEILHFNSPTELTSIFIGGGTPSLLTSGQMKKLLDTFTKTFVLDGVEITVEANPDDITVAKAKSWRDMGVNRVSLGAQSFNNAALRYLGRRHRAAKARHAAEIIANYFDNWNMDLIFGAPPAKAWEMTLKTALEYKPPHIATYSLVHEPATAFGTGPPFFDDDAMLGFYEQAANALTQYDHYEISNFAQPGRQCRHNLLYWRNEEYVGFGPGAYSYLSGKRMRNTRELEKYLKTPGRKERMERLGKREQQVETLIQHFRLRTGILEQYYEQRFGEPVDAAFAEALDALLRRGLLHRLSLIHISEPTRPY